MVELAGLGSLAVAIAVAMGFIGCCDTIRTLCDIHRSPVRTIL